MNAHRTRPRPSSQRPKGRMTRPSVKQALTGRASTPVAATYCSLSALSQPLERGSGRVISGVTIAAHDDVAPDAAPMRSFAMWRHQHAHRSATLA